MIKTFLIACIIFSNHSHVSGVEQEGVVAGVAASTSSRVVRSALLTIFHNFVKYSTNVAQVSAILTKIGSACIIPKLKTEIFILQLKIRALQRSNSMESKKLLKIKELKLQWLKAQMAKYINNLFVKTSHLRVGFYLKKSLHMLEQMLGKESLINPAHLSVFLIKMVHFLKYYTAFVIYDTKSRLFNTYKNVNKDLCIVINLESVNKKLSDLSNKCFGKDYFL